MPGTASRGSAARPGRPGAQHVLPPVGRDEQAGQGRGAAPPGARRVREQPVPLWVPTGVARAEKHGYCRVGEARHAADDGERVETAVQELQALQLV